MSGYSGRGGGGGGGGRGRGGGGGRGGDYYKNKYGNKNHGAQSNPQQQEQQQQQFINSGPSTPQPANLLLQRLQQLDGQSYPAYKDITTGRVHHQYSNNQTQSPIFSLFINKTQADPYAKPTRVKLVVTPNAANFPIECYSCEERRRGSSDFLLRKLALECGELTKEKQRNSANSGGGGGGGGRGGGGRGGMKRGILDSGDE